MEPVYEKDEGEEEYRTVWTISVFKDKLREQLLQPIRYNPWVMRKIETKDWQNLKNIGSGYVNHLFLWAAFESELDLMELCLKNGADVSFVHENDNFNALHLAAMAGSVECCEWLLQKGCPIIQTTDNMTPIHYATLGNSKEVVKYFIIYGCDIPSTAVNLAVYASAIDCVKFLLSFNAEVNAHYEGMTPLHLATDLQYIRCMEALLNDPRIDVNSKTEPDAYTALHLAAENGYIECIELLLKAGANINEINGKLQTPLHLVCKMESLDSIDSIEILLRNHASVDEKDADYKTPLHVALAKSPNSLKKIQLLVQWKANVNASDRYGYTPLHLAAINESEECATYLILNGANVAAETKNGITALNMISRKTPKSVPAIWKRLTKSLAYNTERSLKFSFRELINNSNVGEIGFLNTLQKEDQKEILKHPLCRAFLYLKWEKVKKIYIIRVFSVILTACILSSLILNDVLEETCTSSNNTSRNNTGILSCCCYSNNSNGTSVKESAEKGKIISCENLLQVLWLVALILVISNVARNLSFINAYPSFKKYFLNNLNLFELVIMFFVLFLFSTKNQTHKPYLCSYRKLIGTLLILVTWTDLTLVIGQLPYFGTYITMFNKVFKELLKLLTVYFCLLIGFTLTYKALLHDEKNRFENIIVGFAQTLAMMTGELNANDIMIEGGDRGFRSDTHKYSATIISLFFIVVVNMSLMNLLLGIAASDVEGLQKTADLSKLVHQTKLIYSLEFAFFKGYIPKKFTKIFKKFLFVSPDFYRVVIYVRPLNPMENRLPKDIMKEALQLALDKNKPDPGDEDEVTSRLEKLEKKMTKLLQLALDKDKPDQGDDDKVNRRLEKLDNDIATLKEILLNLTNPVTQKVTICKCTSCINR